MTDPQAPIRVVVADDAPTVRLMLRRTLESSSAFVVVGEAANGRDAVTAAEALQPDMVLVDMAMPVMDGLEAIPGIKRGAPGTRVVVLSGFSPDRMGDQAVQVGATVYIEKGQDPNELIASLLHVWRTAQQEQAAGPAAADAAAAEGVAPVFDHAPEGMALVDAEDRFVYVNPAMCRMTGYRRDDLLRLTAAAIAFADDVDSARSGRRAVLAGDVARWSAESRLARPDGRAAWAVLSASALPAPEAGGRPLLVLQATDVSDQKRVERELSRSNAELGNFAFLAAHELKSPLQSVQGFASLLDRVHGPQLDPRVREFVTWIVDGTVRMDGLIEDLLAYCAVDRAEPVLVPVDLGAVVAGALDQLAGDIAQRRAVVDAGPLPSVLGDPVQLGQLVQNLLANALKFVPEGRSPRVDVSAAHTGEGWLVTVADNGIGVEDASSDRIFTMFARLHPPERYKGTGIGLSICKRIVERRGGAIWVEPNPGGGSRFCFSLPDVPARTAGCKQEDPDT